MALTFAASTDKVNAGAGSSLELPTVGTILAWVRPTATTNGRIFQKGTAGENNAYLNFATSENTAYDFSVGLDRATTELRARAVSHLMTSNAWNCVAGVWNSAGVNTDQKLYHGDLTTTIVELIAGDYQTQAVGSGAVNSLAGANAIVGNKNNSASPFPGDIALVAIWNRVLTLGELQDQQFRPRVTSGCVLFEILGYAGTGTQPDWSGTGNAGTVTGATVANHVPLGRPFSIEDGWAPYAVAVATAARFRRTLSPFGARSGSRQAT